MKNFAIRFQSVERFQLPVLFCYRRVDYLHGRLRHNSPIWRRLNRTLFFVHLRVIKKIGREERGVFIGILMAQTSLSRHHRNSRRNYNSGESFSCALVLKVKGSNNYEQNEMIVYSPWCRRGASTPCWRACMSLCEGLVQEPGAWQTLELCEWVSARGSPPLRFMAVADVIGRGPAAARANVLKKFFFF